MSERVNYLERYKEELEEKHGKPICEEKAKDLMEEIKELAMKYHVHVDHKWEIWTTHWGTKKCTHTVNFDFVEDLENVV